MVSFATVAVFGSVTRAERDRSSIYGGFHIYERTPEPAAMVRPWTGCTASSGISMMPAGAVLLGATSA
jgi:hypothetical protein